ncbi:KRI1-like family C-terminal-domain-containing protein [Xylariaceae sp. FL1019]|nr:KRI1-like family C-terminal-domain-containing protein [Xylariaceae sp. FL1019]
MPPTDARKSALFDDSDDQSDGGVNLNINKDYAKRFEHNKKREERMRLEEKYKATGRNPKHRDDGSGDDDDESGSSSDETEDEDGFLATEELDAQISATLQAIKNKDPRVYDGKSTFYAPPDEDATNQPAGPKQKKEKPVFLQDYHREKILRGDTGADDQDEPLPPQTYAQEQEDLRKSLQQEVQAQLTAGAESKDDSDDDDFIKAKESTQRAPKNGIHPSRANKVKAPKPDIEDADKNPELFLSNFLASRAWIEENGNGWQPFESDEGEDDKADEWEAAYNLRFEDPGKSNEVLRSYARDVTAARSVRKEEKTGRKRQRELEREQKNAEKQQRREERARLRRLKLEEAEDKLAKIKKAAGLKGKSLDDEDWQRLLDGAWENGKWEQEMNKTFNDEYYAEDDGASGDEDAVDGSKKKKIKKPTWDDDIDIKDLVPDFDDEERPNITLTDDEVEEEPEQDMENVEDDDDAPAAKRQKTSKERKKEKLMSQKAARQERAKLEAAIDAQMSLDDPELLAGSSSAKDKGQPRFAYRETKPQTFGLTTRDILMASDADLNTFVGLKKLAHFRDAEKQAKDRKRLGKKARLRQWRKETFGPEFEREPPQLDFGESEKADVKTRNDGSNNIVEGSKKKRKRSRPKKGQAVE